MNTYFNEITSKPINTVDGKVLYENGEYLTLDKEKIYYDIEKAVKKLY